MVEGAPLTTEVDEFLAEVLPTFTEAEIAIHDGTPDPRFELWSRNDPVMVFGAARDRPRLVPGQLPVPVAGRAVLEMRGVRVRAPRRGGERRPGVHRRHRAHDGLGPRRSAPGLPAAGDDGVPP